MSAAMSPALAAALNASFTGGGWRMVGVFLDRHEETVAAGEATTTIVRITATLQAEHAERGLLHVWTLAGIEGGGYTTARLTAGGGAFETTDATLIARLTAAIAPALAAMQTALIADLEAA